MDGWMDDAGFMHSFLAYIALNVANKTIMKDGPMRWEGAWDSFCQPAALLVDINNILIYTNYLTIYS
eukprot:scaffold214542_cov47-Attheya_sp.AAC.3